MRRALSTTTAEPVPADERRAGAVDAPTGSCFFCGKISCYRHQFQTRRRKAGLPTDDYRLERRLIQ